jgi:O-acetyl-ADP-ribose deacetylase (regulator of RNase III)
MASQADPAPAILTADAIPTLANMYARGTLPTLDPDTTPQPLANCSPAINARVALVDHDITRMAVDAIVNAAANGLGAGGGICGAIHAVAGPAFTKHCLTLGGCNTGDAKITPGFDLPAKHVIHTPGPDCRTGIQMQKADSLLDSSYHACLSLAASHRLDTLVFCPISTGIFAFPPGRAVEIALARVRKFLEHPAAVWPRTIVFTNTHRGLYQLYLRRLPYVPVLCSPRR